MMHPDLQLVRDCLNAGDWSALATAVAEDRATNAPLLLALAAPHAQFVPDCDPADLVPDYDLLTVLRQVPTIAERLLTRAQEAQTLGRADLAQALFRAVLTVDDSNVDARLALAWAAFRADDLASALHHAGYAHRHHGDVSAVAAALGWFQAQTDLKQAAATLTEALIRHPNDATLTWYLGHVRARSGDLDAAAALLNRALVLDPALDEAAVSLAWVLADMGRLGDAIDLAHTIARRAPLPHRIAQLGHLLSEQGMLEAAITLLQHALTSEPSNASTRRRLVTALCRAGRVEEASALLEAGVAQHPDDPGLQVAHVLVLRTLGSLPQAFVVANAVVQRWGAWAEGWYALGELNRAVGAMREALHCFTVAHARDPALIPAVIARSQVLLHLGQAADAAWLMECVLAQAPDHALARRQLAWALIGQHKGRDARPHLHRLLRTDRANPDVLLFLSVALHQLGRARSARLLAQRVCRLAPNNTDALRHSAVLALEAGAASETEALCQRLLTLDPNQAAVRSLVSFALQAQGRLAEAEPHAELAVTLAPQEAESWRCLAHLRHNQQRLSEAEAALRTARGLAPSRSDVLGQLAWVLAADDRLIEAEAATREAIALTPNHPDRWIEHAEILALTGRLGEAIACLDQAPVLQPASDRVQTLAARLLLVAGAVEAADGRDPSPQWQDATQRARAVLLSDRQNHDAAVVAIRLHAAGHGAAADVVRLIPLARRRAMYRIVLEWLPAFANAEEAARVADAAEAAFPGDPDIVLAAIYLSAMAGRDDAETTARRMRHWGLTHARTFGQTHQRALDVASDQLTGRPEARLRVAYFATHVHHGLLLPVLAAHDPAVVQLHLYTDDPAPLPADLRQRVVVHPLTGHDLAASCAANGMDVVVDTVGPHPFHGQALVLQALRRRLAPLQCGWIGAWCTGAGVYDLLISDGVALPADERSLYSEAVLPLRGGQWAWLPPLGAPTVRASLATTTGQITFGCVVRGFRIGIESLDLWVQILAAVPMSRLVIIGRHGRDWEFRHRVAAALAAANIPQARVVYRQHKPYGAHFALFHDIDIALDTVPANGGLGLADLLWMGVPVVTLAGKGMAARQGAALLSAAGLEAWIANDPAEYVRVAVATASDLAALSLLRHGLRARLAASPLLDARRITAQLEEAWMDWLPVIRAVAAAGDLKSQYRLLAQHTATRWLADQGDLALPVSSDPPEVSVVLVLFNQAGLTLQTLRALADQRGVSFETIVVDNASTDQTSAVLKRVRGASVLRNEENVGFVLAANQGAALARGRFILFLNNDALPHAGALAAATKRLTQDPSIGVVGGRIIQMDGTLQEAGCLIYRDGSAAGYGRGGHPDQPEFQFVRDAEYVSGAFLLIRRSVWDCLGGFDQAFAPAYYEDADLCLRARRAGFRVVYDPAVVVTHLEGGSAVSSGAAAAMTRANQDRFRDRHRTTLTQRVAPAAALPLRDRWASLAAPRVLMLDNTVPHQAVGAGNPRTRLMLHSLVGCHLTYFPLWGGEEPWEEVYATVPETTEVMLGQHATTLEAFLEQRRGIYDIMIVSRPPNMALVADIRRRRPFLFQGLSVIYDAEALFALRDIGAAAVRGVPLGRNAAQELVTAELELAAAADCVLAVSEREAKLFARGGARSVHVLCHAMATNPQPPAFDARTGFLFVGALTPGSPNEDGLLWLCRHVLPRLEETLGSTIPLAIVGECKSRQIAALASKQVTLVGRVDDLTPWYDRSRVFLAPTRFGAGVPLKVIEAACAGVPAVATNLLVRQLGWMPGRELLVANDADGFAAAMATLYQRRDCWERVQSAALQRAAQQYTPSQFARTLRRVVGLDPLAMEVPS
ncbi:MAG: tetratricopeptide repeat protein [Alphaproteobacteria bacterium]|nr:tetratricopeptide repeat protein [Alphaproteobacteria bacterium]